MADRDEIAELKHENRQLKRMLHEEYEKRMALEKEERKICRAIIGNEYIVCGHKQCNISEHINCCKAILRKGMRKGEVCNIVNFPIKAHKRPNATIAIKEGICSERSIGMMLMEILKQESGN